MSYVLAWQDGSALANKPPRLSSGRARPFTQGPCALSIRWTWLLPVAPATMAAPSQPSVVAMSNPSSTLLDLCRIRVLDSSVLPAITRRWSCSVDLTLFAVFWSSCVDHRTAVVLHRWSCIVSRAPVVLRRLLYSNHPASPTMPRSFGRLALPRANGPSLAMGRYPCGAQPSLVLTPLVLCRSSSCPSFSCHLLALRCSPCGTRLAQRRPFLPDP